MTSPPTVSANRSIANTKNKNPEVLAIFTHWQQVMQHPHAKLDKKRAGKILQGLRVGYSVEQLKQAIDGCAATPFNMGENDRRQKYDDISLIFRDGEHIERFISTTSNTVITPASAAGPDIFAGVI